MARLHLTAEAAHQIAVVTAWWLENRPAAPDLFATELDRILDLIENRPGIGALAEDVELEGVRKIATGRSRYFVYYRAVDDVVQVLAVWHSSRGEPPPLAPPA